MTLDSRLATILTPDRQSLLFALKGILAMALALWLAMLMQLERPYWALISAVFLQIRPETGLVIFCNQLSTSASCFAFNSSIVMLTPTFIV